MAWETSGDKLRFGREGPARVRGRQSVRSVVYTMEPGVFNASVSVLAMTVLYQNDCNDHEKTFKPPVARSCAGVGR